MKISTTHVRLRGQTDTGSNKIVNSLVIVCVKTDVDMLLSCGCCF
jgi:hypothetical protein